MKSLMKLEYCAFSPLKRNPAGKLDRTAFINCHCHWSQGTHDPNTSASDKALAYTWNWGDRNDEPHTPASIAGRFKKRNLLLVDNSLIDDLGFSLFADRLNSIIAEANYSIVYKSLKGKSRELINAIILHLDEIHLFETGRPIDHIFADLIACISFLRQRVGSRGIGKKSPSEKFLASRKCFWERKLGILPALCAYLTIKNPGGDKLSSEKWDNYWTELLHQINEIYHSARNILLLDPIGHFASCFNHGPLRNNKDLRHLPLILGGHPRDLRQDILTSAGIKSDELNSERPLKLHGSLSDIDARTIYNGPFRLALTDDPSRHLRFDDSGTRDQPTIFVLDSRTICTLALLDLTGLMEY